MLIKARFSVTLINSEHNRHKGCRLCGRKLFKQWGNRLVLLRSEYSRLFFFAARAVCVCVCVCVCVRVCLTLWVVWAFGKISEVPHSVCLYPPTPHISGDAVSHPPGLKRRRDGQTVQEYVRFVLLEDVQHSCVSSEKLMNQFRAGLWVNIFCVCVHPVSWRVCVRPQAKGQQSKGAMHIRLSLWHSVSTVCDTQAGISPIFMCVLHVHCLPDASPAVAMHKQQKRTQWHWVTTPWHPEMSNMWPWQERWTTDREGMKANHSSGRTLCCPSACEGMHITLQNQHFNTQASQGVRVDAGEVIPFGLVTGL